MIKNQKDFFSGLLFMVTGLVFALGAKDYKMGEASSMGAAYFPTLLGILLVLLGSMVLVQGLLKGNPEQDKIGAFAWRPLCYIVGANFVFGILLSGIPELGLPPMGLIIATYALVLTVVHAQPKPNMKEAWLLATILAIGSYVAFIFLLHLQIQALPTF